MSQFRLVFRVHAIQRMFQRRISEEEVKQVVATGETIETLSDGQALSKSAIAGVECVSSHSCGGSR